ncbi:hypothetical protein [Shewanella algae]|uniref:hypothetical protein n=1 Tax=Shewanella algae TaxID=38313 RepID=UPI0031F4A1B2
METKIIEFHLEYNPQRKNPAEVFHAMGNFISAYEKFGRIIAQSVGEDLDFEVELKEVTHGCILAKLMLKIEEWTRPDDLIRELTGEISQPEQVTLVATKEKRRISWEYRKKYDREIIEPYISDIDIALAMEQWSEGTKLLNPDEYLMVCDDGDNLSNVVPFDPGFRFTGNIRKMYSNYKSSHDGEEIIDIFRPCCKGKSKWEVISRKTGKKFNAEITDKKWLEEYQKSEKRLGGSDSLRVHSKYDVVVINGEEQIKNAKIVEVKGIISGSGYQNELF